MQLLKKTIENGMELTLNSNDVIDEFGILLEKGLEPLEAFNEIKDIFGEEYIESFLESIHID